MNHSILIKSFANKFVEFESATYLLRNRGFFITWTDFLLGRIPENCWFLKEASSNRGAFTLCGSGLTFGCFSVDFVELAESVQAQFIQFDLFLTSGHRQIFDVCDIFLVVGPGDRNVAYRVSLLVKLFWLWPLNIIILANSEEILPDLGMKVT